MKPRSVFFLFSFIINLLSFAALKAQTSAGAKALSDQEKVTADARSLVIPGGYLQNLKWDLPLDSIGGNGTAISWKSGNTQFLSDKGKLLRRAGDRGKVSVKMTATVSSGKARTTRTFTVNIAPDDPKYDGYLFAYFEGQGQKEKQEQLRFAASADAVNWSALNNNEPVIASDQISATGGIRDPYIMRSEDGKRFFAVATDMFTVKNGWDHNPGIVLLSSDDLVSWKHGIIDLEKSYPQKFPNVKWVWAPEAIYDPAADKYLVYFTVRLNDTPALDFYCAYANKDFTAFENEPKLLFKAKFGAIDGDIVYRDGLYHFFYKGNTKEGGKEVKNGIQQATAKTLAGPWNEDFIYVDAYAEKHVSVEGSGIFKLNNGGDYVLMYDMYRDHRYEFQRSPDLFHFSQTPESFTKNFNPRHGTVMGITREEAQRLNAKWGGVPAALLSSATGK